jgi:hypothetical protein
MSVPVRRLSSHGSPQHSARTPCPWVAPTGGLDSERCDHSEGPNGYGHTQEAGGPPGLQIGEAWTWTEPGDARSDSPRRRCELKRVKQTGWLPFRSSFDLATRSLRPAQSVPQDRTTSLRGCIRVVSTGLMHWLAQTSRSSWDSFTGNLRACWSSGIRAPDHRK